MSKVSDAFKLLGLPDTATPAEVKAAWRQLCTTCHPDHGGDAAQFVALRQAYQTAFDYANQSKPCHACQGKGKTVVVQGWSQVDLPCSLCRGIGFLGDEHAHASTC